jgi:hypothetical protein
MTDLDLAAEAAPSFARIEPTADGSYQLVDDGILAALLPVEDGDEPYDIVAWELMGLGSPWWQRTGNASYLGEFWRARALASGRPLRLVQPWPWPRRRAPPSIPASATWPRPPPGSP